jgi:hypothetical protein
MCCASHARVVLRPLYVLRNDIEHVFVEIRKLTQVVGISVIPTLAMLVVVTCNEALILRNGSL